MLKTQEHGHSPHLATIFVNWKPVEVPKGPHTAFDLKRFAHVHGDLQELRDGRIIDLEKDTVIRIHGGEVFFTGRVVQIFVNDDAVFVPAGEHTAAYIKLAAKQPPADCLDQLIDGEFKPLKDTDTVKIHGGERFICQPKTGKTS